MTGASLIAALVAKLKLVLVTVDMQWICKWP
jgi:hypothetical protein